MKHLTVSMVFGRKRNSKTIQTRIKNIFIQQIRYDHLIHILAIILLKNTCQLDSKSVCEKEYQ